MCFRRVSTAAMSVRVSSWYEEVGKYQDRVASCLAIFMTSVMKIRQFKFTVSGDRLTGGHAVMMP